MNYHFYADDTVVYFVYNNETQEIFDSNTALCKMGLMGQNFEKNRIYEYCLEELNGLWYSTANEFYIFG